LGRGIAPSSHNLELSYAQSFFRWAAEEGFYPADPTRGITRRRNEEKPRVIDAGLLGRLIASIPSESYADLRDKALILTQLDTAIRPGEALHLPMSAFDGTSLLIPAALAKSRKSRALPLSPQTSKAIRQLIASRHPEWRDAPLFASSDGVQTNTGNWGHRLKDICGRAGLPRITPYALRHSAATLMLRNGADAFTVQRILGHTTPTMTMRYVHLNNDDIRRVHDATSALLAICPEIHRVRKLRVTEEPKKSGPKGTARKRSPAKESGE
jgi:integrase